MTRARILDGKARARALRREMAAEVGRRLEAGRRAPCLAVVLVGEDPASAVYVRNKQRACEEVGIESRLVQLPQTTPPETLRATVADLNGDAGVDGLLVQLPLPSHLDAEAVRRCIAPQKDVDGLHPENLGLLAAGTPRFVPCTPAGCLDLLASYGVATEGRRAVVVGRSLIVGRPMALLLSARGVDATVTQAHSRSRDLAALCREAEILVVAAGRPGLVGPEWTRPGAAVLDVGIHRLADPSRPSGTRLVGDVDPEVAAVAGFLSPVPGGVGPMTVAMLLRNTLQAHEATAPR